MNARKWLLNGGLEDANQCEPHWLEKLSELLDAYARQYADAQTAGLQQELTELRANRDAWAKVWDYVVSLCVPLHPGKFGSEIVKDLLVQLRAEVDRLRKTLRRLGAEELRDNRPDLYQTALTDAEQRAETAEERVRTLTEAIEWALGSNGEFRARKEGGGAYWWRKELRERAALAQKEEG